MMTESKKTQNVIDREFSFIHWSMVYLICNIPSHWDYVPQSIEDGEFDHTQMKNEHNWAHQRKQYSDSKTKTKTLNPSRPAKSS